MRAVLCSVFLFVLSYPALTEADDLADGIAKYEAGDFGAAFRLLLPLAEQGVAEAQTIVGLVYDTGEGVALDDSEALYWYRLAAGQRDPFALYLLGTMYDLGEGVPEDNVAAVEWYRMAADLGQKVARELVLSWDKFAVKGEVLTYDTTVSEISGVDTGWLEDILQTNPQVTQLRLSSLGGDILVAYDMAEVIIDFGLDTLVVGECSSACVILFLAGEERTMQPGSQLGFHQTSWGPENMREVYEALREKEGWQDEFDFAAWAYLDAVNDVIVELNYMLTRGVESSFAIRSLRATPDDMWYPRRAELTVAGVLRP